MKKRRLSQLQKHILAELYRYRTQKDPPLGAEFEDHRVMLIWLARKLKKLKKPPAEWPGLELIQNGFQVSVSRSIRNLQSKGLIKLKSWGVKTSIVSLTEEGLGVATLMLRSRRGRRRLNNNLNAKAGRRGRKS